MNNYPEIYAKFLFNFVIFVFKLMVVLSCIKFCRRLIVIDMDGGILRYVIFNQILYFYYFIESNYLEFYLILDFDLDNEKHIILCRID